MASKYLQWICLFFLYAHFINVDGNIGQWMPPATNLFVATAMEGYDPIVSNPLATGEPDPGIRGQIFEPFKGGFNSVSGLADLNSFITKAREDPHCDVSLIEKTFVNYNEYKEEKFSSRTYSSGSDVSVGIGIPEFNIEASAGYEKESSGYEADLIEFFKKNTGEMIEMKAECITHTVNISPKNEKPVFTRAFLAELRELNNAAKQPTSASSRASFERFVDMYGTHFMKYTSLGAKLIYQKLFSSGETTVKSKSRRRQCVSDSASMSLGGSYDGISLLKSFKDSSLLCAKSSSSSAYFDKNKMSSTSVISIGSIPSTNLDGWASKVKESPVPIKFESSKISNMFLYPWFDTILITDYENNSETLNGTALHIFFEYMSASYCQIILGKVCPSEKKGCGFNSACVNEAKCIDDNNEEDGYWCNGCDPNRCEAGLTCVNKPDDSLVGFECKGCGTDDNNKCSPGYFCTNDSNQSSGYLCKKKISYGGSYIAGGWSHNSRLKDFERFGTSKLRSLPSTNDGLSLSLVNTKKLYACGGRTKRGISRTCYKLDMNDRRPRWKNLRNPIPGAVHYHTASTIGFNVWLVYNNKLYDLDTRNDKFREYRTPFSASSRFCAVSNNTYSYVIGVGPSRNEIWVNSRPSKPSNWHLVAKMAGQRVHHACLWLDNNIYITGGSSVRRDVEVFDTVSKNLWETGSLTFGRQFHSMLVHYNRPAVLGGTVRFSNGKNIKTNTIETYDAARKRWTTDSRKLKTARDSFGLAQYNSR